jgi:hypothetical protein
MGMIGAGLRRERLADVSDAGSQALEHPGDDAIAADQDAAGLDLGLEMAVADVPGEAEEMAAVAAAHLAELLGGGQDFDKPSVVEHQVVAVIEPDGPVEVDEHLIAVAQREHLAAEMTLFRIERNAREGRSAGETGTANGRGVEKHGQNRK